MRALTLLLILSVATATTAGCFGKDDDPPANTTPTPGTTPATGTPPTGTTPATPTPGGNTNTTPPKPAPREVFSGNADFTPAPPAIPPTGAPSGTVRPNPFSVPAQFTSLTLNVTWALSSQAPGALAATAIAVVVTDAAGTAVATCSAGGPGPINGAPAPCTMAGTIPATGGDFIASYNGDAAGLTATVQVMAS